jgi:prolyl oligopeptidase
VSAVLIRPGQAARAPFRDDRGRGHARKAAARLKELGYDYLYYENIDGGHAASANLNERAMRIALEFTYLHQRLMD